MKTLNRTLSLVLVLVMVLGLFGVAGAAFTDQAEVKYDEAVGVMTGIGAINGYADGTFKPTGAVTREEAAKMIAYAILGSNVASKLTVAATGFSDVAADRWSAPFISYLVGQGIINGMGDGTFAPTANVTAYQLAKMMLAAAGYGAKGEFTGAGWELAVAVKANTTGIFSGASGVNYSAPATREEAALYIFNGITNVPMVTYSKLTETYSSVPNAVAGVSTASDNAVKADLVMQIAESVYGAQLAMTAATVNGVAGHKWTYKGTTIVSFAADASVLATDKAGTAYAKLVNNADSAYIGYAPDTSVRYFFNGVEIKDVVNTNTSDANVALSTGDTVFVKGDNKLYTVTTGIAANAALNPGTNVTAAASALQIAGLKGVVITFSDTNSNSKYDIVSFTKDAVYQLTAAPVVKTTGAVTKVSVAGITGLSAGVETKYVSGYEGLAKDDVVLWHTDGTNYFLAKATSFTGTVMAYNSTANIALIDGKQYKVSELASVHLATNTASYLGQAGSTFYLDECGFICFSEPATVKSAADNTAYVLATNLNGSLDTYATPMATLLMADGTVVKATISKIGGKAVSADNDSVSAHDIYTFVKNADGTYNLTAISSNKTAVANYAASNKVIDKGAANFFYNTGNSKNTTIKGTASTVFVVETSADIYTKYTGVTNVPNVTETGSGNTVKAVVLTDSNNYAVLVFVLNAVVTDTVNTNSYIFAGVPATEVYDAAGNYDMYTSAVVNGAVGTLPAVKGTQILPGVLQAITSRDGSKVAAVTSVPSGIISPVYDLTGFTLKDGTLTTKGTVGSYIVTDTTKYFVFDVTDHQNPTLTAVTADDIAALDGDKYALQAVETSANDKTLSQVFVTVYPSTVSIATLSSIAPTAEAGSANALTVSSTPISGTSDSPTAVNATGYSTTPSIKNTFKFASANPYAVATGSVVNMSTGAKTALGEDIVAAAAGTTKYAIGAYVYPFVSYSVVYANVTVS